MVQEEVRRVMKENKEMDNEWQERRKRIRCKRREDEKCRTRRRCVKRKR